jgi:hypothetical protein
VQAWGDSCARCCRQQQAHLQPHQQEGQASQEHHDRGVQGGAAADTAARGQKLFTTQGISTWVLQQDNDPTHRCAAAELEQYNKDNASSVQLLQPWPPSSPDLNPIENLWAWVQREVDQKGCNSYEEFKAAVIDTIAAVPKQHLVNLCDSMPKRLQAVVEKKGDLTKY